MTNLKLTELHQRQDENSTRVQRKGCFVSTDVTRNNLEQTESHSFKSTKEQRFRVDCLEAKSKRQHLCQLLATEDSGELARATRPVKNDKHKLLDLS